MSRRGHRKRHEARYDKRRLSNENQIVISQLNNDSLCSQVQLYGIIANINPVRPTPLNW